MMTEIICAVGLLGLITTCFFMTVNGMKKAEANFIRENRAILILDNTLERVKTLKERTPAKIKAVFNEEYRNSILSRNKHISADCEIRNNSVYLSFNDLRSRTVAEVTINTD